jgi:phosphatidylglycerol:prolipoprotein diacylglycerol transferase
MCPELFEIPFVHITMKSYGLMMVIGFLAAVALIRHLSRNITPDPQLITNAALYSLIAGVAGARLFFVVHHFDKFQEHPLDVFSVWKGGLELLGGVLLAIAIILFYLWYHKLPIRRYLDILAIGLMLALVFGRIGCFLNGCCFGKPTKLPWGVRFPYGSFAYRSQVEPDPERNRQTPHMQLPEEFFSYDYSGSTARILKPYQDLTERQKRILEEQDKQRSLRVHPTQLYSSANAGILCLILYLFWRRSQPTDGSKGTGSLLRKQGYTFSLMFMLYGITRFAMEFVRDDNPFEIDGLTISQIISFSLITAGAVFMAIFHRMKAGQSGR